MLYVVYLDSEDARPGIIARDERIIRRGISRGASEEGLHWFDWLNDPSSRVGASSPPSLSSSSAMHEDDADDPGDGRDAEGAYSFANVPSTRMRPSLTRASAFSMISLHSAMRLWTCFGEFWDHLCPRPSPGSLKLDERNSDGFEFPDGGCMIDDVVVVMRHG
jgi:hypothetical protein